MSPDSERSLMWTALKRMARHLRVSANAAGGWMARVSTPISRQAHDDDGSLMSAAHEEWVRVVRVRQALDASGPIAQGIVGQRLAGIELSGVWHILVEACKDIALYYGGSVVAGAAVGGVAGFFVGGVGAVPGVAGGAAVGAQVGAWMLALLGLKSLVEYLGDAIPDALRRYEWGFREAWRPGLHEGRGHVMPARGDVHTAARHFAEGHVIVIAAMLAALVAYLTRGRGDRAQLLKDIRNSPRLGPEVAHWVQSNEGRLLAHPELKAGEQRITMASAPRDTGPAITPGQLRRAREAEAQEAPKPAVAAQGAGSAVRYTAANAGPLRAAVANTFRGGTYTATTLSEPLTLYRGYGGTAGQLGSYWTRSAPAGPLQLQLDSALVPSWGNTLTGVSTIRVPAGTTIFEGFAAPQSTGVGQLLGGGSQVYIPKVNPAWLVP